MKEKLYAIFYGLIACSFMPHWACHYYRIETESSFVVESWNFTVADSIVFMIIYSIIILLNLFAISFKNLRVTASLIAGIVHLTLGIIHIIRIINPFKFEIFYLNWSLNSSVRECIIIIPFGILCILLSYSTRFGATGKRA